MKTWTSWIIILVELSHTWGAPMNTLDTFHELHNIQNEIPTYLTTNQDTNKDRSPFQILQHTNPENPDGKSNMIISEGTFLEKNPNHHNTHTIPDIPYPRHSSEPHLLKESKLNYLLCIDDDNCLSMEDLLSTPLNPEDDQNLNMINSAQPAYSTDAQWVNGFSQKPEKTLERSDIGRTYHQLELPRIHSPTLNSSPENLAVNSYYRQFQPPEFHPYGEVPTHLSLDLTHRVYPYNSYTPQESILQANSIDHPSICATSNPEVSAVSDDGILMEGKAKHSRRIHSIEPQANFDSMDIPITTHQTLFLKNLEQLTHDRFHPTPSSEWQEDASQDEIYQGMHSIPSTIDTQNINSTPEALLADTVVPSMVDLPGGISENVLVASYLHHLDNQDTQKNTKSSKRKKSMLQSKIGSKIKSSVTETSELHTSGFQDNGAIHSYNQDLMKEPVHDKYFYSKLVGSICIFGKSLRYMKFNPKGPTFIGELKTKIVRENDPQDLWSRISRAHGALTMPFIGLLLTLHPQEFSEKLSRDELIQDGFRFMEELLSKLYTAGLKHEINVWETHPHQSFDISEPSTLIHYTSKLTQPSRVPLTTLWKFWKRWFRTSTYPRKTVVWGLPEFARLIERNLMKLKSLDGERIIDAPFESFANQNHIKGSAGKASRTRKLRWRDLYRPAMYLGKAHYEMLTLRVEADGFFDKLDVGLKSNCLFNDNKTDSRCIQKVDLFVRKLYYELLPCFLGSLVASQSRSKSNKCLEELIDDGWKFFRNFLQLLERIFPKKGLEESNIVEKEALNYTLTFFETRTRSADFSLETILALLTAWANQSSYPNKKTIRDEKNGWILLEMIHDK
ncbi:hypothetical protein DFH28DRAFT_1035987, partial [Melampsora americana]